MDVIEVLKSDHQKVKNLFTKFTNGQGARKSQESIVQQICDELKLHTAIEEEIFYPAVQEVKDEKLQELVEESFDEHQAMNEMVGELEETEMGDDELSERVSILQEDVERHVEEEETEMFPRLQKVWQQDTLDRLGQQIVDRKHGHQAEAA